MTRRDLAEYAAAIASVAFLSAIGIHAAATSSRVQAIEERTAALQSRVALDVRELPGGYVALIAMGFDGSEEIVSLGRMPGAERRVMMMAMPPLAKPVRP